MSAVQSSFKLTFFASFRLPDPPDSVKKIHQLLRCFKKLIYLKEVLESCTIISTENETDTRIHSAIYANHKKGKVLEATRPYVRCEEQENPRR